MSSPSTRLRQRHAALHALRAHLVEQGFLELDTPLLVPGPGLEPHIDPLRVAVRTSFTAPADDRWLITSPELSLKRALAALCAERDDGAPAARIFQLGHVFRDGERGARHLPEFTLLEHYRAPGTLEEIAVDIEELADAAARALDVPAPLRPYHRSTVAALFQRHAGIDLRAALAALEAGDPTALARAARAADVEVPAASDDASAFEDAFFAIMDQRVEPALPRDRPTLVERWPAPMAVLARRCDDDPLFAARFEIYAFARDTDARPLELCNAFDELTDPVEQRARFEADNARRRALGKPTLPLDEDFLAALARLPRSAGCALGVDRLLMALTGAAHIDEVTALAWR